MSEALLRVRDLRVAFRSFRGLHRVVDGVSFTVLPGEQVGVVGESGSGKSVTMLAAMGLLPASAAIEADELSLNGIDLRNATDRQWAGIRGSDISMVFQNPLTSLNPSMRVGQQISEPVAVHSRGKTADELRRLAEAMLREVAVANPALRADQYPYEFSGGMRQRAVIAMALAGNPSIVIADEPTTALDVTVQAQIVALMRDLAARHGLASVVITHDLGLVAEMVDRVLIMYAGRIVEETPVAALFDGPAHPYTRALLESRPTIAARQERLNAIPGVPPASADAVRGCSFHPRCAFARHREICRSQRPPLTVVAPGRTAACHFWEEVLASQPPLQTKTSLPPPRPQSGEVVLKFNGATKHYGKVRALSDVSLELHRSETLGIAGESGCGKSTLARVALGLVKPTAGEVLVKGQDISKLAGSALRAARRNIQMVFQDPTSSLDRRLRVRAIVAEPLVIAGVARAEADRRVEALMDAVGLSAQHLDAYPSELSGGQRQRVGIARALALNPDVVIFDEPTAALDVSIQAQIVNLLDEIKQGTSAGYVFIAHDLGVLRHVSDRIAVMYLGRIVETGPAEAVFEDPRHPYTRALLASAPAAHPKGRSTVRPMIQGAPPDPTEIPSGCAFRSRCPRAQAICASEAPVLRAVAVQGHFAACHFANEPRDEAATEQNLPNEKNQGADR